MCSMAAYCIENFLSLSSVPKTFWCHDITHINVSLEWVKAAWLNPGGSVEVVVCGIGILINPSFLSLLHVHDFIFMLFFPSSLDCLSVENSFHLAFHHTDLCWFDFYSKNFLHSLTFPSNILLGDFYALWILLVKTKIKFEFFKNALFSALYISGISLVLF